MIIGVTADTQFREQNLAEQRRGWHQILDKTRDAGGQAILHAGDVFDLHNIAGRVATVGTIIDTMMTPFDASELHLYVVPGNHDQGASGQQDALAAIDKHERVHVMRRPGIMWHADLDAEGNIVDQLPIACIPWVNAACLFANEEIRNLEKGDRDALCREKMAGMLAHLRRELDEVRGRRRAALLGHLETSIAMADNGHVRPWGAFSVPAEMLEEVGADRIFLGHFHLRQGLYVGAPWQLDHRYEGHPCGFVLWNTDTNEETWIPLDVRQFVTISSATTDLDLATRNAQGIRWKDEQPPPAEIAERVQWHRPVQTREAQARVDVSADATPAELLARWHEANASADTPLPPLEALTERIAEVLDRHAATIDGATSSCGSLDRIRRVRLQNIGPFANLDLDLSQDGSWAVCGPNGAGKTFAVEAIVAALYGRFPSRDGTLYDHMTRGHIGDARIEMEFEAGGQRFLIARLLRKTAKTVKQEAFLYYQEDQADSGWASMAGPEVKAVEAEVLAIVGPMELILASIFCSQWAEGDLTTAPRATRKDILRRLLGIDYLEAIGSAAKDETTAARALLDAAQAAVIDATAAAEDPATIRENLETYREMLHQEGTTEEEYRKAAAALEREAGELEAEAKHIEEIRRAAKDALDAYNNTRQDEDATRGEIEEKRLVIAGAEKTAKDLNRLREVREALAGITKQREAGAEARAARADIERSIAAAKAELESLRINIQNDIRQAEYHRDCAQRDIATAGRELLSRKRILEQLLETQQAQAERLDQAGCKSTGLLACRFIDDARGAPAEIARLKGEIALVEARLAQDEYAHEERDTLRHQEDAIRILRENLENNAYGEDERTRIHDLEQELEDIEIPTYDAIQERALRQEEQILIASERILGRIEAAKDALPGLQEKLARLEAAVEKAGEILEVAQKRAQGAENLDGRRHELQMRQQDATTRVQESRERMRALERGIAELEGRIEKAEANARALAAKKEEAAKVATEHALLQTLARAFGPDGIPQLLISAALPAIEAIAQDLLQELDGQFAITFETQAVAKSGSVRETIDILASDWRGTRDVSSFSGGEQKLLRNVIRLSIALYQAQRHGARFRVFILDEALDALDPTNQERMLAMLRRLEEDVAGRRRFNQIFAISHTPALLAAFPLSVDLSTLGGAGQAPAAESVHREEDLEEEGDEKLTLV